MRRQSDLPEEVQPADVDGGAAAPGESESAPSELPDSADADKPTTVDVAQAPGAHECPTCGAEHGRER